MTIHARGRLLNKALHPQSGVHVAIIDTSAAYFNTLKEGISDAQGGFFLNNYEDDLMARQLDYPPRRLTLRVSTPTGRLLIEKVQVDDSAGDTLDLGDIIIPDASGWVVTLGGLQTAFPVRHENAIQFFIDNEEAWGHLARAMVNSNKLIYVMQLFFGIPAEFDIDPNRELPNIVLSFDRPVIDNDGNPRIVHDSQDYRPERLMIDKSAQGRDIRIIIQTTSGLILAIINLVIAMMSGPGQFSDVRRYFAQIAGDSLDVETYKTSGYSFLHAKVALIDGNEAMVLASPFTQGYFDTIKHIIDEPKRGALGLGVKTPVHDVSAAVRGPAIADMYTCFQLYWNSIKPADKVDIPNPDPIKTVPDPTAESITSLQLVRTLGQDVFPTPLDKGEKGILEAYVRAIDNARQYIYLETQYFTNDTIADALISALKTKEKLQVILMLNLELDLLFYSTWQVSLIKRIIKALQEIKPNANHAEKTAIHRIRCFTSWSHEAASPPKHKKPRIIPTYIHTKVGIVDGKWATIGSANLDGASLDGLEYFHPLLGNYVNHEINYVIYNGVDGDDNQHFTNAIDVLRRRLWGEHLGLSFEDDKLQASNPLHPEKSDDSPDDWLKLWHDQARDRSNILTFFPNAPVSIRILEYPRKAAVGTGGSNNSDYDAEEYAPTYDAEEYLTGLGISLMNIELVESVPKFSFHNGQWQ